MRKPVILISGGAGYIGSHVNKLLSENGFKTVVFDNLSTGHREFLKWGEFFKGDLGRKEDIEKCFSRYKIGAVMHFAASIAVGESVSEGGRLRIRTSPIYSLPPGVGTDKWPRCAVKP